MLIRHYEICTSFSTSLSLLVSDVLIASKEQYAGNIVCKQAKAIQGGNNGQLCYTTKGVKKSEWIG